MGQGSPGSTGGRSGNAFRERLEAWLAADNIEWIYRVFLLAAGVAAWSGLVTLIEAARGESLMERVVIAGVVAAIIGAMSFIVKQLFQPIGWRRRLIAIPIYGVLLFFTAFFGFGFYWGLIVAPMQQLGYASTAVNHIYDELDGVQRQVILVENAMTRLAQESLAKSAKEGTEGNSCPGQRTGGECGPICQWRADQARIHDGHAKVVKGQSEQLADQLRALTGEPKPLLEPPPGTAGPSQPDLIVPSAPMASPPPPPGPANLDAMAALPLLKELERIGAKSDEDERQRARQFDRVERELNSFVRAYNTFRASQTISGISKDYAALSENYASATPKFENLGATFICRDNAMKNGLDEVVSSIASLPSLESVDIPESGRAAGTYEAFGRLFTTLRSWTPFANTSLGKTRDEIAADAAEARIKFEEERRRYEERVAVARQQGLNPGPSPKPPAPPTAQLLASQGLEGRDFIALMASFTVDFMILFMGMFRTNAEDMPRTERDIARSQTSKLNTRIIMAGLEDAVEDPQYQLVRRHMVKRGRRNHLAIAGALNHSDDMLIEGLVALLEADKLAWPHALLPGKSTEQFLKTLETQNPQLAERVKQSGLTVYRLSDRVTRKFLIDYMSGQSGGSDGPPPVAI